METYHKIQTLFKRDMDGSLTGKKGKMIVGEWTTPELAYLADNQWEFTEKVDGTNIRIGVALTDGGNAVPEFAGRSDNAIIPKPLIALLEETFPVGGDELSHWMIDNRLKDVPVVLFGEGYGAKIQNGGNYRPDTSFVLFDVRIGDWWLDREGVDSVAADLGIDSVPTIGTGTLHDAIDIVSTGLTFDKSGAVRRWGGGTLQSRWGSFAAEGIVATPLVPLFDRKGQRIITKIKAVDFR